MFFQPATCRLRAVHLSARVMLSKYVSLGSIIAAAFVPILAYTFGLTTEFIVFGIIAALFVIYRHKTNIVRLLQGNENKIKAGHR